MAARIAASAFACAKADQKAGDLAENEQTHDDATQKQNQTDAAAEPPAQEGQATSNTEQVEGLDAAPPRSGRLWDPSPNDFAVSIAS